MSNYAFYQPVQPQSPDLIGEYETRKYRDAMMERMARAGVKRTGIDAINGGNRYSMQANNALNVFSNQYQNSDWFDQTKTGQIETDQLQYQQWGATTKWSSDIIDKVGEEMARNKEGMNNPHNKEVMKQNEIARQVVISPYFQGGHQKYIVDEEKYAQAYPEQYAEMEKNKSILRTKEGMFVDMDDVPYFTVTPEDFSSTLNPAEYIAKNVKPSTFTKGRSYEDKEGVTTFSEKGGLDVEATTASVKGHLYDGAGNPTELAKSISQQYNIDPTDQQAIIDRAMTWIPGVNTVDKSGVKRDASGGVNGGKGSWNFGAIGATPITNSDAKIAGANYKNGVAIDMGSKALMEVDGRKVYPTGILRGKDGDLYIQGTIASEELLTQIRDIESRFKDGDLTEEEKKKLLDNAVFEAKGQDVKPFKYNSAKHGTILSEVGQKAKATKFGEQEALILIDIVNFDRSLLKTSEDKEAYDWVMAHPDDPKARQTLDALMN